jgi:hypothetical protein
MTERQPELPEIDGEGFDRWLIKASLVDLEEFIAEAPQALPDKPVDFLRDLKERVDKRLAARPHTRFFSMSDPQEIRVVYWMKIADMFEAEINCRTARSTEGMPEQLEDGKVRTAVRDKPSCSGAQKDHWVSARRTFLRQNRGVPDQELCEMLDREEMPLPKSYSEAGYKTWSDAWRERKSRIQVMFSKDRNSG